MPGKIVISIVDDDVSVREGATDLLNSMGYAAETFACADDFLKSARLDDTSCLITDMRMPGMTGLELHDRLVASGRTIPTILVTAFPTETDRARALKAGVHCYLPKPFDERDLLSCLQSALNAHTRGEAARPPAAP
jgi:FixJ family two-component response regulator